MTLEIGPPSRQQCRLTRPGRVESAGTRVLKPRHNLPTQLTSFIGRERELAEVKRALGDVRLLTLTGAGGIGKTRLALQVAADSLKSYIDGVWLVELAQVTEPAQIPRVVASGLRLREKQTRALPADLSAELGSSQVLLILDNCEHLVSACAELAERLLRTCPYVRVLATSREALGVGGETIWRVPALSMPFFQTLPPVERLTKYEAIRLFLERATAVAPGFSVTEANAPAVAQICHRLDGLPLAIELAAARVKVLSPEQILARLNDRFSLLTGGSRTALPRYQTLRGLVDWSHALLSEAERILFRRLAVFAGGWTLDAAEAVCAGEGIEEKRVLDLLQALVDKSLVLVEDHSRAARYGLLETLRQYGIEKLRNSEEETVIRQRHRNWFVDFAERTASLLNGPQQAEAFDRLEEEHDNLRAALEFSRHEEAGWEAGSRIAGALAWFWVLRGYRHEGQEWLSQLLAAAPDRTVERARLLVAAGLVAHWDVDPDAAAAHLEEGLRLWRTLGDRRGIATAMARLGQLRNALGDYDGAWSLLQQSAALSTDVDVESGPSGPLTVLLAQVAKERGDYARAEPLFEESLAIARERGDPHSVASALRSLGELSQSRGACDRAAELFRESLILLGELDDRPCSANCFEQLAHLAMAQSRAGRAVRLLAAARSTDEASGFGVVPARRAAVESALSAARAALGAAGFEAAWSEGQKLEHRQAVEYALAGLTPAPAESAPPAKPLNARRSDPLTGREREIAVLISRGLQNRQIGAKLVISERTVESHVANILSKLGFSSRTQIASWAADQVRLDVALRSGGLTEDTW